MRAVVKVVPMALFRAVTTLVLGLAVAAVGCGSDPCVGGAGPIVSQTLDLSSLTGFDFQVGGEVTVVPGSTQQVVVRSQQNVLDILNRDVINGIWEIGYTQCAEGIGEFSVDITVPANTIETILSGAGTVTLSGEVTSQQVTLEGSGTVEAFDLTTDETSVLLTGQGTVSVRASEQLNVDLPGAGAVFYKGDPQLNVRVTGAGSVVDANP
jgi:hypothetical protein